MLNNVSIGGRLTADAELRHTQSGKPVTNFTLAVDRPKYGDKRETDFISCTLWNREGIVPYLTKGKGIMVTGAIRAESYEDKDGNRRVKVYILVDQVSFMFDSNRSGGDSRQRESQEMMDVPFSEDNLPF